MEHNAKKPMFFVGVVVIVIVAGLVFWYIFQQEKAAPQMFSQSPTTNATTTQTIGGVTFEIPPGSTAKIEQVPIVDTSSIGPAPSLNRTVVFPDDFPQEAQNIWKNKFADIKTQLAQNPHSYDAWLQVGLEWNMIEDYEGARLAWDYATKLVPSNAVAFGNLGFLYGYYLHDNIKAEHNFKTALYNAPQELYIYHQAFEFYRDVLKDKAKARALAGEGKRVTSNVDFFGKLIATL